MKTTKPIIIILMMLAVLMVNAQTKQEVIVMKIYESNAGKIQARMPTSN